MYGNGIPNAHWRGGGRVRGGNNSERKNSGRIARMMCKPLEGLAEEKVHRSTFFNLLPLCSVMFLLTIVVLILNRKPEIIKLCCAVSRECLVSLASGVRVKCNREWKD